MVGWCFFHSFSHIKRETCVLFAILKIKKNLFGYLIFQFYLHKQVANQVFDFVAFAFKRLETVS